MHWPKHGSRPANTTLAGEETHRMAAGTSMHGKCQGPATSREGTAADGPVRCVKAMTMTRGSLTGNFKSAAAFSKVEPARLPAGLTLAGMLPELAHPAELRIAEVASANCLLG
eukprot:353827-Chlamydomonas_euryale.AAC.10